MNLSLFLFWKLFNSSRQSRFLSLISTISILGICLGVAILIIALSVVSGFEKTLTKRIIELDSHIKIFTVDHRAKIDLVQVQKILSKFESEIDFVSPNLSKTVIITKKKNADGIILKGIVNPEYLDKVKANLIEGIFSTENKNKILIGKSFAKRLFIEVNDKVLLVTQRNDDERTNEYYPEIEQFTVSGIYESGITDYDDIIAFTDLSSAQEFLTDGNNFINGVDLKLKNLENISVIVSEIRDQLEYPLYAQSIFEIHRNIFTWIELQKKPIPIVLSLIIIVAVFNIISTLFIMDIDKTSVIGILKSLGLKRRQIIYLFLFQGLKLTLYGIFLGNILAIILMSIQKQFNIIKIPSSIYFVTEVPFDFSISIFIMVSMITFILAMFASLSPSIISSKINPIKAIKFQ